ncbi:hypothetical protein GCM10009856_13280 [Mycolicibacterium llatzerense]
MPGALFNPPPSWPVPRGWHPSPEWEPDPEWPPAPPGWQFWVDEHSEPAWAAPAGPPIETPWAPTPSLGDVQPQAAPPSRSRRRIGPLIAAAAVVVALIAASVLVVKYFTGDNGPNITVLKPVDAQGNPQPGWEVDETRRGDSIDCSFGGASRYDVSTSVRFCGATADSGDACWPADQTHVLCVVDAFSKVLHRVGAVGLGIPRKPLEGDPRPFALVLDDGTKCQARNGGAWSRQKEQPEWYGYFSCDGVQNNAAWGPDGKDIDKDSDGWHVFVGPYDGHLTKHKVAEAYYVGVAGQSDATDPIRGGGTRLVTKCGRPPELRAEEVKTDSGALVIRMRIVAKCHDGDVLSSSRTGIVVSSGGQNIAAGVFDLSANPIIIEAGSGDSADEPSVAHDFRFPVGTFWRLPVSKNEAPGSSSSRGEVDIDAKTLLVECEQSGSSVSSGQPKGPRGDSDTATGPAKPASGDDESSSFDALRAIAEADRPFVSGQLADRWVPQLSSKRPGLVADGITWHNAETLREHLQLRLKYPEVRLLWSGDWSTFSASDFWVTIAGVTFPSSDGALDWCRSHNLDRDHCYAKLVSTTHPVDGTTAFNQ